MSKVIFRRIGGRIIALKFKNAAALTDDALKASAQIRSALKSKIAAKTNLHLKRQSAIKAVREVLEDNALPSWQRKPAVGTGQYLRAASPASRPDLVVKWGASRQVDRRAKVKAFLAHHGLAPETFHVKTGKRSFLVQPRLEVLGTKLPPELKANEVTGKWAMTKFWRKKRKLQEDIAKKGLEVHDITEKNVGVDKRGKMQVIDAGATLLRGRKAPFFNKSQRDYAKKFRIAFRGRKK